MLTPLQAEALVAVIGIDKILSATPTLNQEQRQKAGNLQKTVRAMILRFFARTEITEGEDLPPFEYLELSKQLQNVGESQTHALYDVLKDTLDDDDAQAVVNVATGIIVKLQGSIPRRVYRSVVNETVMPPEPYSLGRWQRQYSVACDPMLVLRDLQEDCLDAGMVSTLQQFFPEIYKMILSQVDNAIATMKTRRGDKWDLDEDKNRDLKILLGIPYLNFDLANAYAAVPDPYTAPADKTAGPPAKALSDNTPDDQADPEELPGQTAPTS